MREDGVLPEEETLFAELVVSQGLATRAQVEECLDLLRKMRANGLDTPPKLGELLRDRGYLSKTADLTLRPSSVARTAPADGVELPPEAADPSNRFGKYVRTRRLGAGGMGEVWRAYDTELGRWVALKFLNSHDPDELARFKREAHTAAKLNHPNIGAVYDVGEHAGRHFIAMHLIEGVTLAAFPRDDRRALAEIVRDVARAVHYAHERGIIHRDLKPQNVMVESNPRRAYVMDFGLARQLRQSGASLTVSGMMIGTPSYMAPEQARGESHAVDARTDVYGLGATLYHVLVGRPPFEDPNLYDLVVRVVTEEPVTPRRVDRRIDEDLEKVVLKALDKDPSRRYPTAKDFADDLTRWLEGEPVEARAPSTLRRLVRKMRRNKPLSIAAGVLVLVVLGAGVLLGAQAVRHRKREDGLRRLAQMWQTIIQRKQDLRQLRASPEAVRRDLAAAVAAVDEYVREWPDEPQGYYVKARGLWYLGDVAGAERQVRDALARSPGFRPGWTLLGALLEERQLAAPAAEARRLEQEAAAAFGRGWTAATARAEMERWGLAWSREDFVLAKAVEVREAPPERRAPMLLSALEEYRAEEFEHLLGVLARDPAEDARRQTNALTLARGYAAALLRRADLRLRAGEPARAEEDAALATALRPDLPVAHSYRARALDALGRLDEAAEEHDRAVRMSAGAPHAHFFRACAHLLRGEHGRALPDLDRALAIDPEYADAYSERGVAKYALGRYDEAIADWTKALELDAGRAAELLYNRANARLQTGDLEGAIADLGRAAESRPGFAEAWARRGLAQAMRSERLEGAEARQALEGAESDLTRALDVAPPDWAQRADVESRRDQVRRLLRR